MAPRLEDPGRGPGGRLMRTRMRPPRQLLQKIESALLGSPQPLVAGKATDAIQRTELGESHQALPGIANELKPFGHHVHLPPRHRAPPECPSLAQVLAM